MGKGCSGGYDCGMGGGYSGGLGLGGYGARGMGGYGKPGKSYSAAGLAYAGMMNQQNSSSMPVAYPVTNFSKMSTTIYKDENKSINPFTNTPNSTSNMILQTMTPFNYMNLAGIYNQTSINYSSGIHKKQNRKY